MANMQPGAAWGAAPPVMPARGALAGAKADAKQRQQGHDTGGIGNAFSHNFLNQKPWHPLSFRNQMKKFEVETKAIQEAKMRETAQAEFLAEQEKMETYSLCSEAEQKRHRDRQSISFLYTKPPGLEAALAKQAAAEQEKAKAEEKAKAIESTQPPGPLTAKGKPQMSQAQHDEAANHTRDLDRIREDPYAALLSARVALQNNERFAMKQSSSGTYGGFSAKAQNQQLLEDDEEERPGPSGAGTSHAQPAQGLQGPGIQLPDPATLASMSDADRDRLIKRLKKVQKQQERERKLREAEAILRSAGFDLDSLPPVDDGPSEKGKKRKKHSKEKKSSKRSKHSKEKKEKSRHSSSTGSDS